MKNFKWMIGISGLLAASSLVTSASAVGFDWHILGGLASPHFQGNTQNITVDTDDVNQYTVNAPSQTDVILGGGLGYQWDYSKTSLNLGLRQ